MKKIYLLLFILIALLSAAEDRQTTDPYQYGYSARAIGMGRTAAASSYDSHGLFTNPAAIAGVEKVQFGLSSFKLFNEYSYLGLSSVIQTGFGPLGLSFLSMGVDDIPLTDITMEGSDIRIDKVGSYTAGDRVFGLTYAVQSSFDAWGIKNPAVGVTGKVVQSFISGTNTDADETLSSFGVDVGMRTELNVLLFTEIKLGLAIMNIVAPKLTPTNGSDSAYMPNTRIGLSRDFSVFGQQLIVAADVDAMGSHTGLEYVLDKAFMLRAGVDGDSNTLGLGYKIFSFYGFDGAPYTFELDYAYHQYPEPLENLHLFSVSLLGVSKTRLPTMIMPFATGSVISANTVSLQGTAEPDAEITIFVNNKVRKIVRAEAAGVWQAKDVYLDDGRNDLYCTAQVNNFVISDPSDIFTVNTDQKPVSIKTTVFKQLGSIVVQVKANKAVRAVVSKFPDNSRISLQFDPQSGLWSGDWSVPPAYSNTYVKVQTIAVDFSGNRSEIIDDYVSTKIINYPNDRTITTQKYITVKGQVKDSVKQIQLADRVITPDAKGYFAITTTLNNLGKNVLSVVAIDADGQSTTSSIRVLRLNESADIDQVPQARRDIASLLTLGDITVDQAQEFHPQELMTREAFAKALVAVRDLPLRENAPLPADVNRASEYAPAISAVLAAGYLTTTTEGLFKPTTYLQRKDAVVAVVKVDELDTAAVDNKRLFTDVEPYMPFAPYVAVAVKTGLIQPGEKFEPDQEITKAEAIQLLARSKYAQKKINELYNWNTGYGAQFEAQPADTDFGINDAPLSFDKNSRLKVIAPEPESLSTTATIVVKGYCVSDNLQINGVPVPVKQQRFAVDVSLNLGKNYIVVEGAEERVILKVLYTQRFADLPDDLEALPYNNLAQLGVLNTNAFGKTEILRRSEFLQIMAGLSGQQYVAPATDGDVLWSEALVEINRYDGKDPKDTSLVKDIPQYKQDAVMTHDDLVTLLMKTERYQKMLSGYKDFGTYTPQDYKPDRVQNRLTNNTRGDRNVASSFSADPRNESDDYLNFLKKFDQKEYLRQKNIDRTGESIIAGGKTEFELTYPENDFIVSQENIPVTGVAKGGQLKINGQVITPGADGRFKQTVDLKVGKNTIAVQYNDEAYTLKGVRLVAFRDIDNYREKRAIQYLATAGYFNAAQLFNPEQQITREEYVVLLVRMLHETPVQTFQKPYPDVDSRRWTASSIQMLKSMKILPENGNFNPEGILTQKEAAAWFTKASQATLPQVADDEPLRRVDVVRWLIRDTRVQQDLNALRS